MVAIQYNRRAAKAYAERWWNSHNPDFVFFEKDDCTNFTSQVLYAGNAPMWGFEDRTIGWWYEGLFDGDERWSFSWSVANAFRTYLVASANLTSGLRAVQVKRARDLTIGDIICYDWDGDGRWQHNTVVVAFTRRGTPLVNAHTDNSRHRKWRYKDSRAYTKNTQYNFFHIVDEF